MSCNRQKSGGNILLMVLVIILAVALMVAQLFSSMSVNERVAFSHIQQIQTFERAQNLLTHCLAALETENSGVTYIAADQVVPGTLAQKLNSYDKAVVNKFADGGCWVEEMPAQQRDNVLKRSYRVVAFAYRRRADGSIDKAKAQAVWLQARKIFIIPGLNGTATTGGDGENLKITPIGSEVAIINGGETSQHVESPATVSQPTITIIDNWSSLVYQ